MKGQEITILGEIDSEKIFATLITLLCEQEGFIVTELKVGRKET